MANHLQIKSDHPYQFRTGQWACIDGVRFVNGRPCWHVFWPDHVMDLWVIHDPQANYEYRECEVENDPEPEARAPGDDPPLG